MNLNSGPVLRSLLMLLASTCSVADAQAPGAEVPAAQKVQESIHAKRQGKAIELSLTTLTSEPEASILRDLTNVEFTERMSTQQLERWSTAMPGEASRQTLTALADASVFLNLSAAGNLNPPPMDAAAQQQLRARMNAYVDETMARLPNFFASQSVSTYEAIQGLRNSASIVVHQPMHYIGQVTGNIHYRNGKEVVETARGEMQESDQMSYKLLFIGQFGPVLNTVLADAQQNKLAFSHWEQAASWKTGPASLPASLPASPAAVFRYSVPRKASHTSIKVIMPGNTFPSQAHPGYHGEITVEPATGTILRLTLLADLTSDDPMSAANLMVEYGPVSLGGETYICPVRSVTLETILAADAKVQSIVTTSGGGMDSGPSHLTGMTYASRGEIPSETLLNDVAFHHFQILRSESTILTGPETTQP